MKDSEYWTEEFERRLVITKLRYQLSYLMNLLKNSEQLFVQVDPYEGKYIKDIFQLKSELEKLSMELITKLYNMLVNSPQIFSDEFLLSALKTKINSSLSDFNSPDFITGSINKHRTIHYNPELIEKLFEIVLKFLDVKGFNRLSGLKLSEEDWISLISFIKGYGYVLEDNEGPIDRLFEDYKLYANVIGIKDVKVLKKATDAIVDYLFDISYFSNNATAFFTTDSLPNIFTRFTLFYQFLQLKVDEEIN